jgi:hypothetical protein
VLIFVCFGDFWVFWAFSAVLVIFGCFGPFWAIWVISGRFGSFWALCDFGPKGFFFKKFIHFSRIFLKKPWVLFRRKVSWNHTRIPSIPSFPGNSIPVLSSEVDPFCEGQAAGERRPAREFFFKK